MDELSEIQRSEPNRRGNGHRSGRRIPTEELRIERYTKTTRVGYENIVDAGSTFRIYCWGNMLACGESGCRDVGMISVGR